ncbi:bifunctional [glutamine synthetase] adenylyltransferase/[glutamine synthetase]-adenylyl-L-tyrosine phosphorylase [Nioella sp.]|uniref:bifunctional [glutamine synthetase] adenylyltransferase/[glutamine synthetase]-adenylyl-L-tyrosine phosphorylase n=1 Tax=Nioella sp. TaxID=1912091 RepID=UPI003A8BA1AD
MSFVSRLTRHPIPFDPDRGADALAHLPDLAPELRPLIEGTGGCSPYLLSLIGKERDWLAGALTQDPDEVRRGLLLETGAVALSDLAPELRRLKRRVALYAALADLGGVWPLEQVTGLLTDFADAAVDVAIRRLVAAEAKRGKIPGMTEEDAETGAGMVALAMGKMGAGELNYSSDIDLIVLFDETRFDRADEMEARASFIKVTRRMTSALADVTRDGYVFRTDLRLRPDASVTPVCISMAAAERYYEAEGRNWERAAYIKARPCAGDIAAGDRFLNTLTPFVWRKHLDFAAIQDTHEMREKIRRHKGLHGPITLEGHNMKLGAGGIREIEFFAQTRQIVSGGRDPDLRCRGTVPALAALAEKGWIDGDVRDRLTRHYRLHREIEHRVQMVNDAQTHLLPNSDEGIERLARFCGEGDTAAFRTKLRDRLAEVDRLCEPFFKPEKTETDLPDLSETAEEIVARWPGYPALRSARGQAIFARLKPDLLARFAATPRPEEALGNFDGFLRGLPAGVQLFSLFEANPPLVDLIVDICGTAPGLSRYLSRNSGVLDAVIGGDFFAGWPDRDDLSAHLEAQLEGQDYEGVLNTARRWLKEWHFRVGVHHLRGLIHAEEAGAEYSMLAQVILRALWPRVCDEVARRHGPAPGRGGSVVAMGSLGAGRLTAGSDLDLLVIYDPGGVEFTEGRRPLDPRGWFAKATKTLITALTAPTGEGKLYDVDMRLRPSGRQGPVATALEGFRHYQMTEAWTWEHLALTRARPVAGDASLCADIEAIRMEVLTTPCDPVKIVADAQDMRDRLAAAGRVGEGLDAKEGPGRMKDVELLAETAALIAGVPARDVEGQLEAGVSIGWIGADDARTLAAAHHLYGRLNHATRLLTDRRLDLDEIGSGGRSFIAREAGVADSAELAAKAESLRTDCEAIINQALAQPPRREEAR